MMPTFLLRRNSRLIVARLEHQQRAISNARFVAAKQKQLQHHKSSRRFSHFKTHQDANSKIQNEHFYYIAVGSAAIVTASLVAHTTSWMYPNNDHASICHCDTKQQSSLSSHRPLFNIREVFDIQEELGGGSFATVFRAIRKQDGKEVALKAMPTEFSSSLDFQREIHAMEILSNPGHDHVCKLYSQYFDGKFFYLALELIGGGELFEYLIKHGPFSEQDASKFLRQFSQALVYIHSKGFIHADLKPENLMLGDGKLKIVDFGCARYGNDHIQGQGEAFQGGTAAYLPPEIYLQRQQPPTQAMDCFAAGVIMYIVLTGSHPFDPTGEATDEEIKSVIRKCQSRRFLEEFVFDERTQHLSKSSIALMKALMQPDPKHRMTSHQLQMHPWICGQDASDRVLPDSDVKLKRFWQKRFRAAILDKFGEGTSDKKLREIFRSIDLDGNEKVDIRELQVALVDLDEEYMEDILNSLDANGDGTVDFEEFKAVMNMVNDQPDASKRKQVTRLLRENFTKDDTSPEALRKIFNSIDLKEDGTIHISELKEVLLGFGMNEEEISAWADSADSDMDGDIGFEEFSKVMTENLKDD